MIIGADAATDRDIVVRASTLYDRFSPSPGLLLGLFADPRCERRAAAQPPAADARAPAYQSDWLMRFYGFTPSDVRTAADPSGMLPLDIDPKLAWALEAPRQLSGRM
jgi:predicted DNA-binding helix-hairpin-helix protein